MADASFINIADEGLSQAVISGQQRAACTKITGQVCTGWFLLQKKGK